MMLALFIIAVALQGIAMLVDEAYFHRRRELPRWERIGHPLDTLTIVICLAWLVAVEPSETTRGVYIGLAVFSTLFVTKDEFVHAKLCTGGEQWLHAVLFVLHPIVLFAFAGVWWTGQIGPLVGQLVVTIAFGIYQVVYWNRARRTINNDWYADLGARWYTADDTPIALLRAESRHRNPWIAETIPAHSDVLDLGCGGGFLSNYLAERGHRVTGIDTTMENLVVAKLHDPTRSVAYQRADACALPHPDASFDVVCAMDLIEHVEDPARLVAEASRVLRPGGLFFFHTFDRNWLSNLIVIKGVAWFVKNAPADLHVLHLFRTPAEVTAMIRANGMEAVELRGSRPRFRWPLWRMLLTGRVGDDFAFAWSRSTKIGYTGYARKLLAPRFDLRDSDDARLLLGRTTEPPTLPVEARERVLRVDELGDHLSTLAEK